MITTGQTADPSEPRRPDRGRCRPFAVEAESQGALDACVGQIVALVETSDPSAVRLSIAEADAYLSSFGDLTGTAARRADLVGALRKSLPITALADEVIEAIARGAGAA